MKILLVYPYFINDRIHVEEIGAIPMGLYSVAAMLKKNHYDVEIMNWCHLDGNSREIPELLETMKPDVIGFSVMHGNRWGAIEIARRAKEMDPLVRIVAGGVGATFLWEHLLTHFREIDYIILGEGEVSFLKLLEHIAGGEQAYPRDIHGIAFREANHSVKAVAPEPVVDLDALPIPAEHFVYQHISSSRGCVWDCAFCGSPKFWGRKVRFRSPRHFVDELTLLRRRGISFFYFSDDTFTLNKDRAIEICRMILERNLDIAWYGISRVDCVDEEMLYWMRRAGCIQISYGVESGSERIRRQLKKHIRREDILKAFSLTRRYGILPRAYFIYGSPGETTETIEETIALMREIKPLNAIFYILDLFPGTELYETYMKRAGMKDDIWLKRIEGIMYFETDPAFSEQMILGIGKRLRETFYEHLHTFVEDIDLVDRKDLYPYHADFCSRLAMTFSHGDYSKIASVREKDQIAERLYTRSIHYCPNHRAYLGLGILKQKQGDYRASLGILSGGLESFPDSESLHICAGISCMNLQKYASALSHFSRFPDSSESIHYLPLCRKALAEDGNRAERIQT